MGKSSKRYKAAKDALEPDRLYSPTEAIRLLKGSDTASFDETVEVHIHLGVNTRHADQQVRGTIVLPYGTGQDAVSYTHLRAHETDSYLVCRLLLEKKKNKKRKTNND